MSNYLLRHTKTPQSAPLPGQVRNSTQTGHAYPVSDWTRLERFLILGTEGGTYYLGEKQLTEENAQAALRCIEADGVRTIALVVKVSTSRRAPSNDPSIFVHALASVKGDETTRQLAFNTLYGVARTGTDLFHWARFREALGGGWGRGARRAVGAWYTEKPIDTLVLQLIKYRQRDGWSHRDLLRLSHPALGPVSMENLRAMAWALGKADHEEAGLEQVVAFGRLQAMTDASEAAHLIASHRLPRECVPTELLNSPLVWEALLQDMPPWALVRNLAKMTAVGLVTKGSEGAKHVCDLLADPGYVRRGVHPMKVLVAADQYGQGHGFKGSLTWKPVADVITALDVAFYNAFATVTPTGQKLLLAVDISGSMREARFQGRVNTLPGTQITPMTAAAAMMLITANTEPQAELVAFCDQLRPMEIDPKWTIQRVVEYTKTLNAGGTDCALPMLYALGRNRRAGTVGGQFGPTTYDVQQSTKRAYDAFVLYTDNETWAGAVHPAVALQQYRAETGIPAKLVTVGMTSTGFSIAEPNDAGMMDLVGMDADGPALIANFIGQSFEAEAAA